MIALGFAALAALWIALAPFLADVLVIERPLAHADAIVILSGAADYAQRAQGGAQAFRDGLAPRVLITDDGERGGWDDREKGNPFFVERMEAALRAQDVPADAIERLPGKVHGTDEEAELAILAAATRGYRSILIVTSDYHSRRALWTFDRVAAKNSANIAIGIIRSPSGPRYPGRYTWWMTRRGWRTVGAEYVKFGYYWLFN